MAAATRSPTLRAAQAVVLILVSCQALAPTRRPKRTSSAVLRWHGEISHRPATEGSRFLEGHRQGQRAAETHSPLPYSLLQTRSRKGRSLSYTAAAAATVRRLHRSAESQARARTSLSQKAALKAEGIRKSDLAAQARLIDNYQHKKKKRADNSRRTMTIAAALKQREERKNAKAAFLARQLQAIRENRTWTAKDQNKEYSLQKLMIWLVSRHCSKHCKLDLQAWDNITDNRCKTECIASANNIHEASRAVRPLWEHPISYPMNETKMQLHPSNDKAKYTGMMFAGGVKVNNKTSFVARLCTHNCRVGEKYYDSTMILGELEANATVDQIKTSPIGDVAWHWKQAAEHWVPHDDGLMAKGDYVGPEDPRMDVLQGKRFVTLSMNIPTKKLDCPYSEVGIRHMFFVPVDDTKNYTTCDIQIPEVDKCKLQKNWSPLVPRGSEDIYYVYSIRPLAIMRFKPRSCETSWAELPTRGKGPVPHPLGGNIHFAGTGVHGGTRYVFAKQVDEGDLFFSIGHTPGPDYNPVLVVLLVRNATREDPEHRIETVGVSCPIDLSKQFAQLVARADQKAEELMFLTTSIIDFDQKADVSTITFQVRDEENYIGEVAGLRNLTEVAYKEFKNGNIFQCDQLH